MKIFVFISLIIITVFDFVKLEKKDKKIIYVYLSIVTLALLTFMADYFEFFQTSPLELWISRMEPITLWVENLFK